MEKSESTLGVASSIIGLINPIAIIPMARGPMVGFLLFGVPILGLLLAIFGLLTPNKTKGFQIAGIVLNLLPLAFALLIVLAFRSGSGGWSING